LSSGCRFSMNTQKPNQVSFRAKPTGELNEDPNIKNYPFSFCFSISSLQHMRQTDGYFNYLLCEEPFLHFTVKMAKTNDFLDFLLLIQYL